MSSPASAGAAQASDAGERGLIARIRSRVPPAPPNVVVGIGDDAAVVAPERGALQVFTTDSLVEGVHFDRRFSSAIDIGYKALAVNISDIAAVGGAARLALLSLMLPAATTIEEIDGLITGLLDMAAEVRVTLVGGNITRSPGPLVLDVTAIGSVRPRRILTRGGGRAGDVLYVTGTIGAAAAGLGWLRAHAEQSPGRGSAMPVPEGSIVECVERYRRPEPRARIGALLGRNRAASACMDLSDGLADAVAQVAAASGTGATIDAGALPVHPGARDWFSSQTGDPIASSIAGGDDYELLFAVSKRSRGRLRSVMRESRGVGITRIGELTADRSISLVRGGRGEPLPAGFVHF